MRHNPDGVLYFGCSDEEQATEAARARCKFFNEAARLPAESMEGAYPTKKKHKQTGQEYILVTLSRNGRVGRDASARFYTQPPPERNMLDYVLRTMQPQRQETQAAPFNIARTGQEALEASREHKRTPVFWNTTVEALMAFCVGRVSEVRKDEAVWRPPPNV